MQQHDSELSTTVKPTGWRRLFSSRRRTAATHGAVPPVQDLTAQSWSIYQSCKDLPLSVFIDCLADETRAPLVKEGKPPAAVIAEAWLSIYSEYCGLIGGVQIKAMIGKSREVAVLSSRINRIGLLIRAAANSGHEDILQALREEGFTVSMETLNADLNRIAGSLVPLRMKMDMLSAPEKEDGRKKKAAPTEDDFEMTLLEISKHEGRDIGMDITVKKYCLLVKRLQAHMEREMNRAKSGHGRGTNK